MDNLLAMRAFARVVQSGSFTKAAHTMNIPNSTLTKLVQTLESGLKMKLLNRTTRRVVVTPDGERYYNRLLPLLSDFDELNGSVSSVQSRPSGRIRVEMASATAQSIVIPAIAEFLSDYPDIVVELKISDAQADLIGDGIDCVVRAGALTDPSLIVRHLADQKIVTCASPAYLSRVGTPQTPRDLEQFHVGVAYMNAHTGAYFPFDFSKDGQKEVIRCNQRIAVAEGGAYVSAGLAGLGVIQVPLHMVSQHLQEGKLSQILEEWLSDVRPYYLVYTPNRHVSVRLRVFIDWLSRTFANLEI
ncbi:LysR substrate-binding domain-containing protein [Pararhizobium sp. DWP3-4]|uniref:LysR substrate-binding domain-containing protein n=1 Tax=Pararhizobium sp. DWP3-4 TaxID=2804565 RepID=UPI003CF09724